MKIFHNAYEAGRWAPGAVISIGKFDGIHLGHQKTISRAVKRAKALATRCIVVTFDPYPQQVFGPEPYSPLISLPEKLSLIEKMGVDGVVLLPFSRHLACWSAWGQSWDSRYGPSSWWASRVKRLAPPPSAQ